MHLNFLNMKQHHYKKNSEGYILLFSVILTSILLSIVIGIITMTMRQRIFTQQVNQSTRSFYAADTGLECLIALDTRGDFGTVPDTPVTNPVTASCTGATVGGPGGLSKSGIPVAGAGGNIFDYNPIIAGSGTFLEVQETGGTKICARARVAKFRDTGNVDILTGKTIYEHTIEVWGYNVDCLTLHDHYLAVGNGDISPQARLLVERNLTYTYQTF